MNPIDVVEAKAALTGMAEMIWHYVRELESHGFSRKEALTMALGYQHATVGGMWKGESS